MSAQVCPVVPRAAIAAGLHVEFVDIAPDYPTPGAEQFLERLNSSVVGVVLAPLYGYLQLDWSPLLGKLAGRSLVADLAQGLGLPTLTPLLRQADAAGFSFGIGKGLDTGGALFLSQQPLPDAEATSPQSLATGPLWQGLALKTLERLGLYGMLANRLARESEIDPWTFRARIRTLPSDRAAELWKGHLPSFQRAIALARARANVICDLAATSSALTDFSTYFSMGATHLRQVIRMADAARRDEVILRLRRLGIDCAPAGERPPWAYLDGVNAGGYPNTSAFTAAAIRLPFLGRLSDAEFRRLCDALGEILD